ncbi:MAG: lysophospholipase [Myxococcota bacterium]|nr:lysophospholipase [Myxococcota bacterium]
MRFLPALALVLLMLGGGCGGPRGAAPTTVPPTSSGAAMTVAPSQAITSEDITFAAGSRTIPGTLVRPIATTGGPWPAIVLLAGSGPTDRDWRNPALPGTNGSGKLLAEELARRGAVVVRFDKSGSGKNAGPPVAEWTLDTYREEALAAIAVLSARPDVRADRVFVAGHSEGGIHATRLAAAAGPQLAGLIFLAATGRTMVDTILRQIEPQLRNPIAGLSDEQATAELAALRTALTDFMAGRPVDPTKVTTIAPLQQLVAQLTAPATAGLTRSLLGYDTTAEAPKLALPMLVLNGGKDLQVDAERDGRALAETLRAAGRDVTFHLAPDADHVLKHEPQTPEALRAALVSTQHAYNAEARTIDPELLRAVASWLAARTR